MNYHEKQNRSLSSSLPNRSLLNNDQPTTEQIRNYTLFTDNIKNPPRMTTTDDGSGTVSHPKNIVNNRRRSESFAVYSGQEYYVSPSPNESQNSFNDGYFATNFTDDSNYYSPENLQHHLYPANLNVDKKIVLYKTEMCRTFEETGTCKYGTKCQFAHDPNEIRNIPRHPRYKTEICKTFWQLGNCPYGKRCCFIHTENELRDPKKPVPRLSSTTTIQSQDIYGSVDLIIAEDSVIGDIKSHNTSRSASPSKAAEDLKKTISNVGSNSIFNNLSLSNLPKSSNEAPIEKRRKSLIDDRIEELAMLIGSNCSINSQKQEDNAAPSSQDPEFKITRQNSFELWSRESPKPSSETVLEHALNPSSKFAMFDKSPGSRNGDLFSNGIWSKAAFNPFIPGSQFFNSNDKEAETNFSENLSLSGTSSTKSQGNNHQQLLIDMLNLLDSAN